MSARCDLLLSTAAALGLVAILGGCQSGSAEAEVTNTTGQVAATEGPRVRVRTVELLPESFEERLELTGRLLPFEEVIVSSELGGFVRSLSFEKGDWIEKGQILAHIGDDIAAAQLAQAKADLAGAEANFTKNQQLLERQAVPRQDFVAATAQRDRFLATVHEMELRLARSIVVAPISGRATEREIEAGEVISPGTRVTILQQTRRLKVAASVPDREIAWLKKGRRAELLVDAYPQRRFEARLHFIAPAADEMTRSFPIELTLGNPKDLLRPGMVCRIRLTRRRVDKAVVIPIDAIVTHEAGKRVFVVEDCVARVVPLEPTAYEGDRALIEGELHFGQSLVVEGQRDLVDGQKVASETCR